MGILMRKALITLATLAALSSSAQADTAFTSFAFPATSTPTSRTMPARLSEIKNVKDYGATGDGSTNDRAAIQAAVDNVTTPYSSAYRGVIFFPPGTYSIDAAITFPLSAGITSISFVGANGAKIVGNFNDYLLKRVASTPASPTSGASSVSNLYLENDHATGKCIQLGDTIGGGVFNSDLHCFIGVNIGGSQSSIIQGTSIIRPGQANLTNSIGIVAGNAISVVATDVTSFNYGLIHTNAGLTVLGGRFEVNTIAFSLGTNDDFSAGSSSSVSISGVSMESNGTGVTAVGSVSTTTISGLAITNAQAGHQAGIYLPLVYDHIGIRDVAVSNADGAIFTGTITGTTTLTVSAVTGTIAIGQPIYGAGVTNSPVITAGSGTTWTISPASANVGPVSMASGGWDTGGIYIGGGNYITLENVIANNQSSRGGVTLFTGTNSNNKVSGVSSVVAFGSAWTVGSGADITWDRSPDAPIPTLAQLPAASSVPKGSRRYISDASVALGSQTYGGAVTGGSSNGAAVWSDGTTWRYG